MGQNCHRPAVLGNCFRDDGQTTNSDIEQEFDRLCHDTGIWLGTRMEGENYTKELPDRWYDLVDKVRLHVAQQGGVRCTNQAIHMLYNILEDSPFPPLRPNGDVLKRAFVQQLKIMMLIQDTVTYTHSNIPYSECSVPQLLDRMNDTTSCSPEMQRLRTNTDAAIKNMRVVWGPFCDSMMSTPTLTFEHLRSLQDVFMQWRTRLCPLILQHLKECSSAGRTHVVFYLRWRWYEKDPDAPEGNRGEESVVGHATLLYFDTHRQIQGFFDPNGGDYESSDDKCTLNRYDLMASLLLPGYRLDHVRPRALASWHNACPRKNPVQVLFEHQSPQEEQGYCSSICMLVYLLAHRFDYFDIADVAYLLYTIVRDMTAEHRHLFRRRLSQWQWILCQTEETNLLRLYRLLGVFHTGHQCEPNRVCGVVRANGTLCPGKEEPPLHPLCYCSDHRRLLAAYNLTDHSMERLERCETLQKQYNNDEIKPCTQVPSPFKDIDIESLLATLSDDNDYVTREIEIPIQNDGKQSLKRKVVDEQYIESVCGFKKRWTSDQ